MSRPGPWPTPAQILLLQAALGEPDAALAAWREWRRQGGVIDDLDEGCQRILPQVYRNLAAGDWVDPDRERLKGVYRRVWCENQLLFHGARPALGGLVEAGIETMVIKGAALAGLYPGGLGTRPMRDIDVLVPADTVDAALSVLACHGVVAADGRQLAGRRSTQHSAALHGPHGIQIDLHWEALAKVGDDTALWAAAGQGEVAGIPVLVPSPADQLLHACVHGTGCGPAPMRWMTDAMLVLRASGDVLEWDHLVDTAVDHHATRNLARALRRLVCDLAANVPEAVLRRLGAAPASVIERAESAVNAARRRPLGASYLSALERYVDVRRRTALPASVLGFVDHLAETLNVDGRTAVLRHVIERFATESSAAGRRATHAVRVAKREAARPDAGEAPRRRPAARPRRD